MSDPQLECPACGTPVGAEDRFCGSCMAPLPQPEPTPPPKPAEAPPALIIQEAPVEEEEETETSSSNACPDLKVNYNVSRVFLEGVSVPFELRISVKTEEVTDLKIGLEARGIPGQLEVLEEHIETGETYEPDISFRPPPGHYGIIPFKIYIGYRKGEEEHWFMARRKHEIFRAREKAQQVIESLKIEMHADIEKGQASDGITQRIDNLEALRPQKDDPASELQDIKLPANWKRLGLKKCRTPNQLLHLAPQLHTLPAAPPDAKQNVLTLHWGEKRIHLLSGDLIQFGKNRNNEITTRCFDESGIADAADNALISRFHGQIRKDRETCSVIDKGRNPKDGSSKASAHGLYLNGKRVPAGGDRPLPFGRTFDLHLAGLDADDPKVFGLEGRIMGCDSTAKKICLLHQKPCGTRLPAGMMLHRKDQVDEVFVVVWSCVSLYAIDPALADLFIWRENDGFAYTHVHQSDWLVPGLEWQVGNRPMTVSGKEQYYL